MSRENLCSRGLCDDESLCHHCRVFGLGTDHPLEVKMTIVAEQLQRYGNDYRQSTPPDLARMAGFLLIAAARIVKDHKDREEREAKA